MVKLKRQTHTVPSLQGTLAKRTKPTLRPNFAKEPFRPSRPNAGQRASANLIDKKFENINRQCLTSGHKTLGVKWLIDSSTSHQGSVSGDTDAAPKSPTFHTADRCASA